MNNKEIMEKKLSCILWRGAIWSIQDLGKVMQMHKRKAPWTCPHQYEVKFIGR